MTHLRSQASSTEDATKKDAPGRAVSIDGDAEQEGQVLGGEQSSPVAEAVERDSFADAQRLASRIRAHGVTWDGASLANLLDSLVASHAVVTGHRDECERQYQAKVDELMAVTVERDTLIEERKIVDDALAESALRDDRLVNVLRGEETMRHEAEARCESLTETLERLRDFIAGRPCPVCSLDVLRSSASCEWCIVARGVLDQQKSDESLGGSEAARSAGES